MGDGGRCLKQAFCVCCWISVVTMPANLGPASPLPLEFPCVGLWVFKRRYIGEPPLELPVAAVAAPASYRTRAWETLERYLCGDEGDLASPHAS